MVGRWRGASEVPPLQKEGGGAQVLDKMLVEKPPLLITDSLKTWQGVLCYSNRKSDQLWWGSGFKYPYLCYPWLRPTTRTVTW